MIQVIEQFLQSHPFAELAVLLTLVMAMSYLMKLFKQPLIIGYILA